MFVKKNNSKQINFSILYGVVIKKKKKYILLDYGLGKIKVYMDEEMMRDIEPNYTISISGYIKQARIRTIFITQQASIFDKKPHYIKL